MTSNRKFSNGMWKDQSKKQEAKSDEMFLTFQASHGSIFEGMRMNFHQVTGECAYSYIFTTHEYVMTLNRDGIVIQDRIVKK